MEIGDEIIVADLARLDAALGASELDGNSGLVDVRRVIEVNARDGHLYRKAAGDGHMNIVKFFLRASDMFTLSAEAAHRCTNRGAEDRDGVTPLHLAACNGRTKIVSLLISSGTLVNWPDHNRRTPLHLSAANGHLLVCQKLLEAGASITALDSEMQVPLHLASANNHFQVAQLLISRAMKRRKLDYAERILFQIPCSNTEFPVAQILLKASDFINTCDKSGKTPLDYAVLGGHGRIALLLISKGGALRKNHMLAWGSSQGRCLSVMCLLALGANPNAPNEQTPLRHACRNNHEDIVRVLLQKNALVNLRQMPWDDTPIHVASHCGIIQLLLDNGASVNETDSYNRTALHRPKSFNVQEFLIKKGADPHLLDNFGTSILHNVSTPEFALLLLQQNVLVDARDKVGSTPLHSVSKCGPSSVAQLLIEYGASVNAKNRGGETPLLIAVYSGNFQIAKILLDNEADHRIARSPKQVTQNDSSLHGNTRPDWVLFYEGECGGEVCDSPLHSSARKISPDLALLLISYGAQVNACNEKRRTPLHIAACRGMEEVIKVLLQNKANTTLQDVDGRTPLDLAIKAQRVKAISLLNEYPRK